MYTGDLGSLRIVFQIMTIALVGSGMVRDLNRSLNFSSRRPLRQLALFALAGALIIFLISSLLAIATSSLSINDLGVFVLQVAVPIMVLLSRARLRLVLAIGTWAVLFALFDAGANFLGVAGIIDISAPVRVVGGEVQYSYAGFTGSTLASGFVAFAAVAYLMYLSQRGGIARYICLGTVVILLVSLNLIEARRYFGLALVAVVLFQFAQNVRWISLPTISLVVAALFLYLTFSAAEDDGGNILRGLLILNGAVTASEHPVLGSGPRYIETKDATATFVELSEAGVTESQLIDFAIEYGMLAAGFLFMAVLITLGSHRTSVPFLPAIVLTAMTSELFFGGSLASFAGTLLFYGSLGACLDTSSD